MDQEYQWEFEYFTKLTPVLNEDVQKVTQWMNLTINVFSEFNHRSTAALHCPQPVFHRQPMRRLYQAMKQSLQRLQNQSENCQNMMSTILSRINITKYELNAKVEQTILASTKIVRQLEEDEVQALISEKTIKQNLKLQKQLNKNFCPYQKIGWTALQETQILKKKIQFQNNRLSQLASQKNRLTKLAVIIYSQANRQIRKFITILDEQSEEMRNSMFLKNFSTFHRKKQEIPENQESVSVFKGEEAQNIIQEVMNKCCLDQEQKKPKNVDLILKKAKNAISYEFMNSISSENW